MSAIVGMSLLLTVDILLGGLTGVYASEEGELICTGESCIMRQSGRQQGLSKEGVPRRGPRHITDHVRFRKAHPEPRKDLMAEIYDELRAQGTGSQPGDGLFSVFQVKPTVLSQARAGAYFSGVVSQAIRVSPSTPNPLAATITSGALRGYTLLGEASFGRELKCVLIGFTLLKSPDGTTTFNLKATGLAPSGEACIEGEYESQTGRFFFAELVAAGGAAVVDASIPRSQNVLGNYIEEPSLANAAKKGLSSSLSRTADHAADVLKSAPEWTRLPGFQEIRIIFQTDPTET